MSRITGFLIARPRRLYVPPSPLSIGMVIDDDQVYWGDTPEGGDEAFLTFAESFIDALNPVFVGQKLTSFRELCGRVPGQGEKKESEELVVEPMVAAWQQALLTAVAAQERLTPAEILAREFGLPDLKPGPVELPIILEISDFAATAERIDQMLALCPAGIGYRLTGSRTAEAIGENAQYLQRFVRELAERINALHAALAERPAIYLGLQGALGVLAGDPRQALGHILGNCAGLQSAAGALDLYLEDTFIVNDLFDQASLMRQLKEYCRRSAAFTKQPMFALRSGGNDSDEWEIYGDVEAVDVLVFDLARQPSIDSLMSQLATASKVAMKVIISYSKEDNYSPHWTQTGIDMAIASSAGLLLGYDQGRDDQYRQTGRYISELSSWLSHK